MIPYKIAASVQERVGVLRFDPQALPRVTVQNCDLCGASRHQIISWIDRYGFTERFVLCEGCGLVFLNPRPTAQGYEVFYEKYYRPLVTALKGHPETPRSIIPGQRKYADYVLRFLNSGGFLKDGGRVIDIGGSTGIVSSALQEQGLECLVLDPSPDELEIARGYGLQTERGFIETWEPRDKRFDLVLICQTVDHFLSVREALEKVKQILVPEGLLFIDVTDFETQARCHEEFRGFLKLDHCFYLSDKTMRAYFSMSGFEVVMTDISQHKLVYACRSAAPKKLPEGMESYAHMMSALLRERLVSPRSNPYPVDALTRLWRQLKPNGSQ
ncbi:MAG: class I SAM-dependent methyltransferase [Pyrinomonadaceae bacterium]|nr:class I SAM-dependent methyltransferase [Pyrinomonadaceae bacterium]